MSFGWIYDPDVEIELRALEAAAGRMNERRFDALHFERPPGDPLDELKHRQQFHPRRAITGHDLRKGAVQRARRLAVGVEVDGEHVRGVEKLLQEREVRAAPVLADQFLGR